VLDLTKFGYELVDLTEVESKVDFVKAIKKRIKITPADVKEDIDRSMWRQLEVTEEAINGYLQHEAYQMMGWEQIDDLVNRGFQIGSHTRTHPSLSQIDENQLDAEIRGSCFDLLERFDLQQVPFAYPYGKSQHISERAASLARQVGYSCGLTTIKELNTAATDLFQLRRIRFKDLTKPHRTTSYSFDVGSK
jgi:peptidoglycan/xylan/chitin deacetylase (PgdA/CDA1 family)